MKRWPGSTSPEHVIMAHTGGVLSLSPTPLNRESVPGEYYEHLRTSTKIYEHSDAQVDLYSYAMILFECGSHGHVRSVRSVRSCQSMRGHCNERDCQTVRLSGCFAKKSPSRTGKMDPKWILTPRYGMIWFRWS